MKRRLFTLFMACVAFWGIASGAFAQAGLGEGDSHDVVIDIDGHKETITCIRDAMKSDQWYYVPNRFRLETMKDMATNKEIPVFSLVKYQSKNPNNPQEILDSGVLQFSINLTLPGNALDSIKGQLAALDKIPASSLKLAPLSMNEAKLTVYTPGGEKMGDAPQIPDIAPSFANQSIPVQININKLGADVADALVKSGGGIPVSLVFSYNGLTPKAGFKVTCDWDQAFSHYSTQSKSRQTWNNYHRWWWGWRYGHGGGRDSEFTQLVEDLKTTKSLIVEKIVSEDFPQDKMDTILNPIIEKLQKELFDIQAPDKVDPAKAKDPSTSGSWWYSSGSTLSTKEVKQHKSGKTVFDFSVRTLMKRQTSVGGIITLANWPADVQKKCVVIMPSYNWTSAYYSLPDPGDAGSVGITQIEATVRVLDDKGTSVVTGENATWKAKEGFWMDPKGNKRTALAFALAGVYDRYATPSEVLKFEQTLKVSQKIGANLKTATFVKTFPVFDGAAGISDPMSNFKAIGVSGEHLTFFGQLFDDSDSYPAACRGKKSDLTGVSISLKNGTKTDSQTINERNKMFYMLVEKASEDVEPVVSADIRFLSKSYPKTISYKDLISDYGTDMVLTDGDFVPAPVAADSAAPAK